MVATEADDGGDTVNREVSNVKGLGVDANTLSQSAVDKAASAPVSSAWTALAKCMLPTY